MNKRLLTNAEIEVKAPAERVWSALVDPDSIKQDMLGANVTSDRKEDSSITWTGVVNGVKYQAKGDYTENCPDAQHGGYPLQHVVWLA
ncbi:MAG TPA: SRPBCC domain-containing protein [Nitrososphaerales archaeon]|nr:SRPBCC domain-containing protein [Nitrososphaerales archaeon]